MFRIFAVQRLISLTLVTTFIALAVLTQSNAVVRARGEAAAPMFAPFTNAAAITIPAAGVASLYPSPIVVTGLTGVVSAVTVKLNGFSHTSPGDVDILLVSPDNKKFKIVSDAGSNVGAPGGQATVNVSPTFSDAGAAVLTTGDTKWAPDGTSPTVKPTDYAGGSDLFPAPAPAAPYGTPATAGTDTLNAFFAGATPNGTWNLYVVDDTSGDSGSISGGWTIDITTVAGPAATTTTVASSVNPSTVGGSVVFTASVTSGSTVNNGTVTFQDGVANLTCTEGAQPRAVNASGQATCTTTTLAGGNRTISASYTPGAGFLASSGNLIQQVTTVSGSTFSNVGNISIENVGSPNPQQAIPYPGQVQVSGLSGTIATITVGLTGLSHTAVTDVDILLISPGGTPYVLMSDVGSGAAVNVNLTVSDAAPSALPIGAALTSGTFRPTNSGSGDPIPNTSIGPVIASGLNTAAPAGTGTLTTAFGGSSPNGTWSLYIFDDAPGSDAGSLAGGWNLTITTAGASPTTTALSSSNNPSFTTAPNNTTTLTATVTSGGNPVTTGDVTFKEGATNLTCTEGVQPRPLNASGLATCTVGFAAPEGQHIVTAFYNGSASFAISNSSLTQTVANHTTGASPTFCNAGPLVINDVGQGSPYPSLIFVSGLTGAATKVTATVNGLTHPSVSDVDLLLVGPGGQRVVLMSDVGGTGQSATNANLTFDDAAAASLPSVGPIVSGTFKPTDINPGDLFPAPAPGGATATTMAAFLASAPNGTWSVYVVDDATGDAGAATGGVCLNFTMGTAATTTAVTSNHNPAFLGQAVTFTATVSVTAPGSGPATGTVQFKDGATNIGGSIPVDGAGQAQFTTSSLTSSSHSITAVYTPTGNFTGSTSPALTQVVNPLTAANVEVGGRILSAEGRGVGRAIVTITDSQGTVLSSRTGRGGFYRFTVPAGGTYSISVIQGRFRFTPRVVQLTDNLTDLDFVGEIVEP